MTPDPEYDALQRLSDQADAAADYGAGIARLARERGAGHKPSYRKLIAENQALIAVLRAEIVRANTWRAAALGPPLLLICCCLILKFC